MSSELILLLHPDEATRGRLSAALHESGFKVLTAADEGSALGHLAQMRFVLPDALIMPLSENGPLLHKLRQNPLTAARNCCSPCAWRCSALQSGAATAARCAARSLFSLSSTCCRRWKRDGARASWTFAAVIGERRSG